MTATPKPGPRPGPRPGKPAAARPVVAPAAPKTNPAEYGRVDADGTVYVTTPAGERAIASWKAGTPAEGLEHYGNRFDDVRTEVDLLGARLNTHPEDASQVRSAARKILDSLPTLPAIGDFAALEKETRAVLERCDHAEVTAKEEKEKRRATAISRKEALAAEAEELAAHSTEWKAAGDRLRAILDEWKTIRGIDRKTDDKLWKRYAKARDAFNHRRGSHFAELDRNRAAAKRTKESLVEQAEALQDSTDWGDTAQAYADLMSQWKKAGRAPREVDDELWARFKAAQDHFFEARQAVSREKDKEFAANADAKEQLIAEYEPRIQPDKDMDAARKALHELQDKWEAIGFVPRGRVREFEEKIGKLERRVAEAADAQWRRTDPEAQARASQFQARVDELTRQAEAAEKAGRTKDAEALRSQAQQWSEWAKAAAEAVENR